MKNNSRPVYLFLSLLAFSGPSIRAVENLPEIQPVYETLNPTRTKLMVGDELKAALAELPGWAVKDGHLVRLYSFPTYSDAVAFIVRISHPLEAMDHHPDLRNVYGKVYIAFTTHDQGNQISDLDFKAAKAVESIAAKLPQKSG
jgi:4a-hydroxytetrahydrobiopterin dehydratase